MRYTGFRWSIRETVLLTALIVFLVLMFRASRPRHIEKNPRQGSQLHSLTASIELFANEFDGYPPSDANDPAGQPYCGSMKLAEALMGQDLHGFHTKSIFRRDGLDAGGISLYLPDVNWSGTLSESNLKARKGPFAQVKNANVLRLVDIYGKGNTRPFPENTRVLCDVYVGWQKRPSGERTGMPILYYRANPSGTAHDVAHPDNPQNIYNYKDNQALLMLGVPGRPGEKHPLADPGRFYLNTQNRKTSSRSEPHRGDSFILITAGLDGLYGTADDICNFDEWYGEP